MALNRLSERLVLGGLVVASFAVVLAIRALREDTPSPVSVAAPAGGLQNRTQALSAVQPISAHALERPSASGKTRLQGAYNQLAVGSAGTDSGEADPDAVIGRVFPVSQSVEANCKKLSRGTSDGCLEVHETLAEFARQPRDSIWASETEARLRVLIEANPDPYAIRRIECRTSLCVAEVASIFGMFHFIPAVGGDKYLDRNLHTDLGSFGFETDPSTATVTVTLMTFERR